MWPLDRWRADDVIRVGAHAIELWRGSAAGLSLVATERLPKRGSIYEVRGIVEPLVSLARQVDRSRVSLVLESAFVPVLLADTGGVLWNRRQIEALLRHRFGLAYGGPDLEVSTWKLRTDYRFGERRALGFAMATGVESALNEAARSAAVVFTAWVPAVAWGLDRFSPWRRWPGRTGWWAWPEQDRVLLARVTGGRVEALNPAVPFQTTADGIERSVALEAARAGGDAPQRPIGVAHWRTNERLAGAGDRLRWFGVEPSGQRPVTLERREARRLRAAAE